MIVLNRRKAFRGLYLETKEHNSKSDGTGDTVSSVMAYVPVFETSGWPQSALNGITVGGFWFDAYECSQPDASDTSAGTTTLNSPGNVAAVSQAGVVPWASISWENARVAASNRIIDGRPCHLVTPFERFAVLSLVMKSGLWGQLRGNNNNGKDTRDPDESAYYGTADPTVSGRCLTGTGPANWYHNLEEALGIHNLVANIYEWEDCRIESGYIQPKAYIDGEVSSGATYIDYDDNANGDGTNVCQLTPGTYTITDATNGNEDVAVERVIITGRFSGRLILASATTLNHIDNAVIQLKTAIDLCHGAANGWAGIGKLLEGAGSQQMALPDFSDSSTHTATYLDSAYQYDNSDSRALRRCGNWYYRFYARSGLIVNANGHPANTSTGIGFRAALDPGTAVAGGAVVLSGVASSASPVSDAGTAIAAEAIRAIGVPAVSEARALPGTVVRGVAVRAPLAEAAAEAEPGNLILSKALGGVEASALAKANPGILFTGLVLEQPIFNTSINRITKEYSITKLT